MHQFCALNYSQLKVARTQSSWYYMYTYIPTYIQFRSWNLSIWYLSTFWSIISRLNDFSLMMFSYYAKFNFKMIVELFYSFWTMFPSFLIRLRCIDYIVFLSLFVSCFVASLWNYLLSNDSRSYFVLFCSKSAHSIVLVTPQNDNLSRLKIHKNCRNEDVHVSFVCTANRYPCVPICAESRLVLDRWIAMAIVIESTDLNILRQYSSFPNIHHHSKTCPFSPFMSHPYYCIYQ